MKATGVLALVVVVSLVTRRSYAVSVNPEDGMAARAQLTQALDGAGFSFVYGGLPASERMAQWPETREQASDDAGLRYRSVRTCASSGLEVRLEGIAYADAPAVEWVLYLKNTGSADTPIIEDIQALDVTVPMASGDPVLHYAKGATCSIEDYRPVARVLNRGGRTHLEPHGGRSSSDFLPFFNLEFPSQGGRVIAIGWSGEWAADVHRDEQGVRIRCGMAQTHLTLHPGEEIRTPRIVWLSYEGGGWIRGQNLFRAFILAHHRPKIAGQDLEPCLLNGNWGGTSAADHIENTAAMLEHQVPFDYYWIDAEWFGQGKWHQTVGDWTPKSDIYPQGFKPLADVLHASGRKLLLWFEPERVCEGTPWYDAHRDWLLDVPKDRRRYNWGRSQAEPDWVVWESDRNQIRENDRLFNLAIPEARAFLTDYISERIDEFGLDCFRHDANIAPLEFWRAADPPDRQGITEIRWIEGLYAFWDALLERHPGLIIDNCASGGRRIDLESLSRATPFWRTDFPAGPTPKQCHTYGVSFWVPLNATGAVNPAKDNDYAMRSAWAGSLVFGLFEPGEASQARAHPDAFPFPQAKAALQQYNDVRKYFLGDYYPLTDYSQAEDAWMAWQFHRDDLGAGIVQVFRRPASICETGRIPLRGLESNATYRVENLDTHGVQRVTGTDLTDSGLGVSLLERPSSALFIYTRQQ
ncbi:MAG TPA: alpha-galactosidase [Candidatus Hydrogenedentes bacterium]|nr:alpha-galactosidase [Candidatus Hydrogenedentota bacterium]HPG65923.1 alpha-galactosidase [Candidatus Hydrogenedentota bacterium]